MILRPSLLPLTRPRGGGGQIVVRGIGQGMRIAVQGFDTANIRASTYRARRYANVAFRYYRVVIPVYYPAGSSPIMDTLFTGASAVLRFQHGLEYPFTPALTGLAPRRPTTFTGATYVQYDNATWDGSTGYLISDRMDAGQVVPKGAFWGCWTTTELPVSAANAIPCHKNTSSYLNRYEGSISSANSQIAGYGGASDAALTATNITAASASQSGASRYFGPAMYLVETNGTSRHVVTIGDSLAYGVGEGVTGSGGYGDAQGSALGNAGYISRGLYEVAGVDEVNLARGSDGDKFLKTPANWRYRREGLILANPTHVVAENIHNDVSAGFSGATGIGVPVPSWAAGTTYAKWDPVVRATAGGTYIATQGGISSATGPTGTGTSIDGTVTWAYVTGNGGAGTSNTGYVALAASVGDQIRTAVPAAKLIRALVTPDAKSTRSVTSLTSSGTTVTATVASTADLATGQPIVISGATPTTYNGTYAITVVDGTTFTYTAGSAPASSPAMGTVAYSNQFANAAGQTVNTGFAPSSYRGFLNPRIKALDPLLGITGYIDPNPYLENNPSGQDGLWASDGTPNRYVWDGTHPNSGGHAAAAAAVTPVLFG